MIRRVYVKGYKSLGEVDLNLDRLTVIIGPNASGKSNLFDALNLLKNILTSRSIDDAFKDHRGDPIEAFDISQKGIVGLLEEEETRFTIEVDVELDPKAIESAEYSIQVQKPSQATKKSVVERYLRYRIEVAITPKTGILRVIDERLEALILSKDGKFYPNKKRSPFIEKVKDRLVLRKEGQSRPMEYEVGLNYAIASQPVYAPHYPHLVAFREEVMRWQFYYFEPSKMREESPVKSVRSLSPSGEDLAAFYYTLKRENPGQFDNLRKVLNVLIPDINDINPELTEEGKIRLRIRERNVEFSAKVISEGTLRLLGILAICSPTNPATVIAFEEPENGVHPRRLKVIADLLKNASQNKQIIINTHSPILPEYLSEAYLVKCYKNEEGHSEFVPMINAVGIFRKGEVDDALEEPFPIATSILSGAWG